MDLIFLVIFTLVGSSSIVGGKPNEKELAPWEENSRVDVFPAKKRQTDEAADSTKVKTVFPTDSDTSGDIMPLPLRDERYNKYPFPVLSANVSAWSEEEAALEHLYSQGGNLFQGDIVLTEEQKNSFSALNALPAANLWPRTGSQVEIPFFVTPLGWPGKAKLKEISRGIRYINDWFNGCIKLVHCPIPCYEHKDIIWIEPSTVCSSPVGRAGGLQTVRLSVNCVNWYTVVHELFHSFGLWHEHQRMDRDNYVRILWNNIIPELKHAYIIRNGTNTHGIGYNAYSVMHYYDNSFAKPGKKTMEWAGEFEKYCKKYECAPMKKYIWPNSIMFDVQKLRKAYGCRV